MMLSACGRYYLDFVDDQRGFYVVFTPVDKPHTETRGPFRDRPAAMRCLMWLACEHGFAESPVIEEVGRGDD